MTLGCGRAASCDVWLRRADGVEGGALERQLGSSSLDVKGCKKDDCAKYTLFYGCANEAPFLDSRAGDVDVGVSFGCR